MINQGSETNLPISEETMTDLNLLCLKSLCPNSTQVIKFKKFEETINGADWLWVVGGRRRTLTLLVQAKIIQPGINPVAKHLYYERRNRNGTISIQRDKLISEASSKGYYPVYCIFSHVKDDIVHYLTPSCQNQPVVGSDFGCSLISAHIVKAMEGSRANFSMQHKLLSHSIPWMSPFCCFPNTPVQGMANLLDNEVRTFFIEQDLRMDFPSAESLITEGLPKIVQRLLIRRRRLSELDISALLITYIDSL